MKMAARPPPLRPFTLRNTFWLKVHSVQSHHIDRGDVIAPEQPIAGGIFVFSNSTAHGSSEGANVRVLRQPNP